MAHAHTLTKGDGEAAQRKFAKGTTHPPTTDPPTITIPTHTTHRSADPHQTRSQMRDVATSETFREERAMKPRRPRAFWMQGLRPARRYAIEFEGISNRGDRTGDELLGLVSTAGLDRRKPAVCF